MPYIPHSDEDRKSMLDVISVRSIAELFEDVPARARFPELDLPSANEIELRVEADKGKCSFLYKLKDANWQTLLADTDATIISFSVPDGLFLGATVGPHVRIDK